MLAGVLASVSYGVVVRLVFTWDLLKDSGLSELLLTASLGFLFGAPLVMGYLTLSGYMLQQPKDSNARNVPILNAIFLPWGPAFISFLIILAFGYEVAICLIMAGPIFLLMSSIGGLMALVFLGKAGGNSYKNVLAGLIFLPMVGSGVESQLPQPQGFYEVHDQILIDADVNTVWNHIERVTPILPEEQTHSYLHDFGFPRPLEATLSREGVGGVRHASFENNILFVETITEWDKPHQLSFEIVPELSEAKSPVVNDQILGGKYFDVLQGTYTLEPQGEKTLLHLRSQQRVSTFYNAYSSLWTRWIMSELQSYILRVIQQRCEKTT
jgi:hypothetical protein